MNAKPFEPNYENFCNDVLNISSKIRFACILNKNGTRIAGGYNRNVSSHLSESEIKMSLYYANKRWENRGHLAHRIGAAKYSLTEYEKIKQITFPVGKNRLLLISTEINTVHSKIIQKVFALIDDHFKGLLVKQ